MTKSIITLTDRRYESKIVVDLADRVSSSMHASTNDELVKVPLPVLDLKDLGTGGVHLQGVPRDGSSSCCHEFGGYTVLYWHGQALNVELCQCGNQ